MFNRPALPDLIARIRADVLNRLGVDEALRRADAEVYSRALAGGVNGLYGYLDFISQQLFPDTAEAEYLDRHASIWLPVSRQAPVAATGSAAFTVQAGSTVPSGTVMSSLAAVQFKATADATVVGTTATVPVIAVLAGIAGNLAIGQTLNLASPISGVQTAGVSSTAIAGGTDLESDDNLRARVLARIQEAPHGGSANDYVTWAKEVPGVTRAWCYPGEMGAGAVSVRFMRDNDTNPIPDSTAVASVQAYIDARRPATAKVYVVAPLANPLNLTIALSPNTAAVQAAVQAMLAALIAREATPGGFYWSNDAIALVAGGGMLLSHINEAISGAQGETDHTMTVPSGNVTNATGYLATLGTITWA